MGAGAGPAANGSNGLAITRTVTVSYTANATNNFPNILRTEKNRGIRIPVLYTEYLPPPTNSRYNSWISPWQPQIATSLQNCSSAGLYFKITTNGDISSAMQALFEQAVTTARLSQ